MSSSYDGRPPSSYLNVGHHGFVHSQQIATNGSPTRDPRDAEGSNARPQSRGRESSPLGRRVSSLVGLNVLKKRGRGTQTPPSALSQSPSREPSTGSPRPPSRKAPDPPPQFIMDPFGTGNSAADTQTRGPGLPANPAINVRPHEVLDTLPLPPPIPGAHSDWSGSVAGPPGSTGSVTGGSRPSTPTGSAQSGLLQRPSTPGEDAKKKRRSIFSSGKLQKKHPGGAHGDTPQHSAFIIGPSGKEPYDLTPLLKGQPVPELWDTNGNLFVHLYPHSNASFRLDSTIVASSRGLKTLIRGTSRRPKVTSPSSHMRHMSLGNPMSMSETRSHRSSSVGSAEGPLSPNNDDGPAELHLQMPLMIDRDDPTPEDISLVISIRNMFAFLIGQLIVGSPRMPTLFSIFNHVAAMLKKYEFSNFDGSTMGEAAEAAFLGYVADLRLDDVRKSREKTIEALVLGERMKCWTLYNEAYVHGVGKWPDLLAMKSPQFASISPRTQSSMEKSAMDLDNRLRDVHYHLDNFEWPGLFAGLGSSKSVRQTVDVDAWRNSWTSMRKHVLHYYKKAYGNWPPKAKSKKNEFEESGLNRALLQSLYQDFTDLYDMLVNRDKLTERTVDSSHNDTLSEDANEDQLRKLLSEFDRSLTPVRPPIPYDLPKLPGLASLRRDGSAPLDPKKQEKDHQKKIKDNDLTLIIMNSYNRDSLKSTPFLEAFMSYERSTAHGRSINELINIRIGQWIFLYVVVQMLPLLVVDAPGLRWTKGVEYFLCEVPKGSPPWMNEQKGAKVYYRVASTGGVVTMPADVVEHGVEGIYRRSHCWVVASRWSGQDPVALLPGNDAPDGGAFSQGGYPPHSDVQSRVSSISGGELGRDDQSLGLGLAPPPVFTSEGLMAASRGSGSRSASRNSLMPGLEALPVPPTLGGMEGLGGPVKRQSVFDPTKSFDDILKSVEEPPKPGKKKGKK